MTATADRSAAQPLAANTPSTIVLPRLSLRSQLINSLIRVTVYPVIAVWARTYALPWPYRTLDRLAMLLPPRRGIRRERVALAGCTAEWAEPRRADTAKVILYLHGGAFLTCGVRTHRRLVSRIAVAAGVPALSVDYRLLPRHPLQTAVADCVAGYRALLDRGYAPEQIAIAGDSAGGYFAVMVAGIARETGLGMPGALVCLSPLYDLEADSRVPESEKAGDPMFPRASLRAVSAAAARGDRRVRTAAPWRITSPDDIDLTGFPNTLIQVGTRELLRAESVHLARRLADSGVSVRLETWQSQSHVFQAAADFIPEGRAAIGRIGEFISSALGEHKRRLPQRHSTKPGDSYQLRSNLEQPVRGGL